MNTINSTFKVSLNLKIVSFIVSVAFLCTTTAYGLDFSKSNSIRIPLMCSRKDICEPIFSITYKALQIFYENVAKKEEIKDKSGIVPRSLLFISNKEHLLFLPSLFFIVISCVFDLPLIFLQISSLLWGFVFILPHILPHLFEGAMILPFRLTFTFLRPTFYKTYYSKSPVDRAEFILERLKAKAQKRGDKEVLEVLSIVKGFHIVKKWPVAGKVFDIPTGTLDISKGMAEQPAQLQYMIMRRAFNMWYLSQPKIRRDIVYYSDLRYKVSEFLIKHSRYIGHFLIYELALNAVENLILKLIMKRTLPMSQKGKGWGGSNEDDVIYTVEQAMKETVSGAEKGKVYTPEEFAKRFNFSLDMSKKLVGILTSI